jgi:hypothetical protein
VCLSLPSRVWLCMLATCLFGQPHENLHVLPDSLLLPCVEPVHRVPLWPATWMSVCVPCLALSLPSLASPRIALQLTSPSCGHDLFCLVPIFFYQKFSAALPFVLSSCSSLVSSTLGYFLYVARVFAMLFSNCNYLFSIRAEAVVISSCAIHSYLPTLRLSHLDCSYQVLFMSFRKMSMLCLHEDLFHVSFFKVLAVPSFELKVSLLQQVRSTLIVLSFALPLQVATWLA